MMNNAPKRILAVDDDVSSAELVVRVAERCGFEGFATSDSRGVLNLTNALKPSMLCVDICMPNIDANELLQMLAKNGYEGEILIVSGQEPKILVETSEYAQSLGLSVIDALQKPIDFQELRQLFLNMDRDEADAA